MLEECNDHTFVLRIWILHYYLAKSLLSIDELEINDMLICFNIFIISHHWSQLILKIINVVYFQTMILEIPK